MFQWNYSMEYFREDQESYLAWYKEFGNRPFEDVLEELSLLLNTKNVLKNDTIIFEQVN